MTDVYPPETTALQRITRDAKNIVRAIAAGNGHQSEEEALSRSVRDSSREQTELILQAISKGSPNGQ